MYTIEAYFKNILARIKAYVFDKLSINSISKIKLNQELYKLLCSFLFWIEGGISNDSYVYFTNSGPKMVATFVKLLRSFYYELDEKSLGQWYLFMNIILKKMSKKFGHK